MHRLEREGERGYSESHDVNVHLITLKNTDVCRLVVNRRGQMGSGFQVLN